MTRNKYRHIFSHNAFRTFWFSFTFSVIGDSMARVALTWFVFSITDSAEALGLLAFAYTAPIIIGGLLAGPLLDKFDRRNVMIADNTIRGCTMLLIPMLYDLGVLQVWHVYIVALVYGFFMMFTLAGSPSLVPDMVDEEDLDTANALETISYTVASVVGPPIAGFLITMIAAPDIIIIDVISYFLFAFALSRIRLHQDKSKHLTCTETVQESYGLGDSIRLLLNNKILLSTTLMFMAANIGLGTLFVWLPIMTDRVFSGGAELYGILLGAIAIGEVVSAILTGSIRIPFTPGIMICAAQFIGGFALGILAIYPSVMIVFAALALFGFATAPLTIWAQSLRMKIIPPHLRGRTFALLRTMMQGTSPIGGFVAGFALPLLTMPGLIMAASLVIGIPGILGYGVRELRTAS